MPADSVRCWTVRVCMSAFLCLGIVACGGGGGGDGGDTPPPVDPPTEPTGTAAIVQIVQSGAMLTPGAATTFTARVLDASGNALDLPVTWQSSRTAVGIDAAGVATAGPNVDSTLITANVGDIRSAPVMVIVAQPVADARLIADDDVLADPQPIDDTQSGRVGSRFRTTIGGAAPTVGQVLLAGGEKGVSGRVISVEPTTGGQSVVFEVVGLDGLFRELKIDETFDTRTLSAQFPSGAPAATRVAEGGAVEQDFTIAIPASPSTAAAAGSIASKAASKIGIPAKALGQEFHFGPLECETDYTALSLDASEISATVVNSLAVHAQVLITGGEIETAKFETSGELGVKVTGPIELRGQFGGELECSLEFVKLPIPVPPPVAAVVTPMVPIGAKFELNGAIQSSGFSLDLSTSVTQPIALGAELLADGTVNNLSATPMSQTLQLDFDWKPKLTNPSLTDYRVSAEFAAGAYAQLAVTNPLVLLAARLFDIDEELALLELFAGLEAEAQWAPTAVQLTNPDDPSRYELGAKASIGFADDLFDIAKYFGINVETELPSLAFEAPIGETANGLAHSALTSFRQGDSLVFRVDLDPDSVSLTIGPRDFYNVDRVQIWRLEEDGTVTLVAEQEAGETQAHFMIPWTADRADTTNARYFAMVIPRRLGFAPLLVSETIGWRGARQSGGSGNDGYGGMAVDTDRQRVYTVGWTPDQIARPDGTVLPKPGGLDVVVNEWNADGQLVRVLMFGSTGNELPTMAKLGPDGALYVIGNSVGGAPIAGETPASAMSAFIAKIDVRGDDQMRLVWAHQFSNGYEIASGLDFGHDGEIYLAGSAAPVGALGGDAQSQSCNDIRAIDISDCGDVMLTRLDAAGTVAWRKASPLPGWQFAPRVTVGAGSDVWVTALTWCALDGISDSVCSSNTERLSDGSEIDRQMTGVWRYDSGGGVTPLTTIAFDDDASGKRDIALSAATWSADGLTLAGLTNAAFDGHANVGGSDVVVTQLDAFGNRRWSRLFGTSASEVAVNNNLVAIPDGGFYLAFGVRSGLYPPGYGGGIDGVLLRLSGTGEVRWGEQFGGEGDDRPMQLALDEEGGVFVSGTTTGSIVPGGTTPAGGTDMFVLKYSSSSLPQKRLVLKASAR